MKIGFQGCGPDFAKLRHRSGDERFTIDFDFKAAAPGGADASGEKVVFPGHRIDLRQMRVVGRDDDGGRRLSEQPEERMRQQRRILLDGGADAFGERRLRQGDSDAAV